MVCANIRFGSDVVLFDVHCVIDRAVLFAISCAGSTKRA
jgi:hypothetical protein